MARSSEIPNDERLFLERNTLADWTKGRGEMAFTAQQQLDESNPRGC